MHRLHVSTFCMPAIFLVSTVSSAAARAEQGLSDVPKRTAPGEEDKDVHELIDGGQAYCGGDKR